MLGAEEVTRPIGRGSMILDQEAHQAENGLAELPFQPKGQPAAQSAEGRGLSIGPAYNFDCLKLADQGSRKGLPGFESKQQPTYCNIDGGMHRDDDSAWLASNYCTVGRVLSQ